MSVYSSHIFFFLLSAVRILNYSYLKIIASLLCYFHLILSEHQLAVSRASFWAHVFAPLIIHCSAQAQVEW